MIRPVRVLERAVALAVGVPLELGLRFAEWLADDGCCPECQAPRRGGYVDHLPHCEYGVVTEGS